MRKLEVKLYDADRAAYRKGGVNADGLDEDEDSEDEASIVDAASSSEQADKASTGHEADQPTEQLV